MSIFKNMSELEIIEHYAYEVGHWAQGEEEVSERFDNTIMHEARQSVSGADWEVFITDKPAILEAFHDWLDFMCKDGEIHSKQVQHYDYVGKWV